MTTHINKSTTNLAEIVYRFALTCPYCNQVGEYPFESREREVDGTVPEMFTNLGTAVCCCGYCGYDFVAQVAYQVKSEITIRKIDRNAIEAPENRGIDLDEKR